MSREDIRPFHLVIVKYNFIAGQHRVSFMVRGYHYYDVDVNMRKVLSKRG
jgi:hypothetical protein